jgi:hypothetical protein
MFLVPLMTVHAQEPVKAYHQLNLPGFSLEYWSNLAEDAEGWMALGYKHSLVSSFVAYSVQERLLERARWEVYLRISVMQGSGFSAFLPGAYTALGWNVSFGNPGSVHRAFLIPYTGFELGVLTTTSSADGGFHGNSAVASAILGGVHLYSSPGFSCSIEVAILHTVAIHNPIKGRAGFTASFIL